MTVTNTQQFKIDAHDISAVQVRGDKSHSKACQQNLNTERQKIIAEKVNILFAKHQDACSKMQEKMNGKSNGLERFDFKVVNSDTLQILRAGQVVGAFKDSEVVQALITQVKAVQCRCPHHGEADPQEQRFEKVTLAIPERACGTVFPIGMLAMHIMPAPVYDPIVQNRNPQNAQFFSVCRLTDLTKLSKAQDRLSELLKTLDDAPNNQLLVATAKKYEIETLKSPQQAKLIPAPRIPDSTKLAEAQKRLETQLQQLVETSNTRLNEQDNELLQAPIRQSTAKLREVTAQGLSNIIAKAQSLSQAMTAILPSPTFDTDQEWASAISEVDGLLNEWISSLDQSAKEEESRRLKEIAELEADLVRTPQKDALLIAELDAVLTTFKSLTPQKKTQREHTQKLTK